MSYTDQDIDRWRRAGHTEAVIVNWLRNERLAKKQMRDAAAGMLAAYNRLRGAAPGTGIDATPDVVEHPSACPPCQVCHGLGYVEAAGQVKACTACGAADAIAARRAASLAKYSSASGRAKTQSFGSFTRSLHTEHAFVAAREFAANPRGWLVMYGTPGTGKSHLCAAIANSLIAQAKPVIFVTMPQLASSLKRLFNPEVAEAEAETYDQRKDVYARTPTLIIDDIGAGTWTDYDARILFDILDPRYTNELPTVLVSNLDLTSADLFDPRLVDRWTHKQFSTVLHLQARSFRQ